jgi:hypothetical protein
MFLNAGGAQPRSPRERRATDRVQTRAARLGRPSPGRASFLMIGRIMLHRAAKIAERAHNGQTDKTGRPYIEHLRRVADAVETLDEKTVAYLHDVVEKGEGWTLERLEQAGFSSSVVAAVDALTKRMDESEQGFICRAAANPLARSIKEADLKDNLWQAHQAGLSPDKYETGLAILNGLNADAQAWGG